MLSKILSNAPAIIEAITELIDRIRMEPHNPKRHGKGIESQSEREKTERMAELLDRARDSGKAKSRSSASSSS